MSAPDDGDRPPRTDLAERDDDPPVVARMVVEIRSDGRRTVARGAMEDVSTGERAAIEAHGSTPLALAASLVKSMVTVPALARGMLRSWATARLGGKRRAE